MARKKATKARPNRALVYCRVSTKKQVKGESLEDQQRKCSEYCRQHGWEVDRIFVEKGETGTTARRTALQQMLEYCARNKGRIGYVAVLDTSRFTRETGDYYVLQELLESQGIGLRTVIQPIDETPNGRLVGGISAVSRNGKTTSGARRS